MGVVPRHVSCWQGAQAGAPRGRPFADRTGRLIVFGAADDVEAQQAADGDPFRRQGAVGGPPGQTVDSRMTPGVFSGGGARSQGIQ